MTGFLLAIVPIIWPERSWIHLLYMYASDRCIVSAAHPILRGVLNIGVSFGEANAYYQSAYSVLLSSTSLPAGRGLDKKIKLSLSACACTHPLTYTATWRLMKTLNVASNAFGCETGHDAFRIHSSSSI